MVNFILNVTYNFLQFLINLFPVGEGFSTEVHTAFQTLGGYMHILDPIVPWATLLTCLTLIFTVEIGIFGFRSVRWVISHIPFIGGKGS